MRLPEGLSHCESESDEWLVIKEAAKNFYNAVESSNTYSWLGIFATQDELAQIRTVIYLHNNSEPLGHQKTSEVGKTFDALFFAMPPEIPVDLYYNISRTDNEQELIENCKDDIEKRYGNLQYTPPVFLFNSKVFP